MPDQSNFEYIWDTWVEPLINDIMLQADSDFVTNTSMRRRQRDELFYVSEKYFKQKRRELKCEYYGINYKQDSSIERLMDFHKLSAILCRTLIEHKVYDFDVDICQKLANNTETTDIDWFVRNPLINYRLAFFASVVFLYQSMIFLYSTADKEFVEKLKKKRKLDLYSASSRQLERKVHESFENSVVLALSKRDIKGHSFDLLSYATMMYQLEEYNKLLFLNDHLH